MNYVAEVELKEWKDKQIDAELRATASFIICEDSQSINDKWHRSKKANLRQLVASLENQWNFKFEQKILAKNR